MKDLMVWLSVAAKAVAAFAVLLILIGFGRSSAGYMFAGFGLLIAIFLIGYLFDFIEVGPVS